jgi:hypothetical protein
MICDMFLMELEIGRDRDLAATRDPLKFGDNNFSLPDIQTGPVDLVTPSAETGQLWFIENRPTSLTYRFMHHACMKFPDRRSPVF